MAVERRGVKRNSTRVRSVRTGVKRRSRDEEDKQDLEQTVSNYQTRLSASGVDTDTRNPLEKLLNLPEDQNFLFDIAEIIGRPQQALFGAIDAAQKGKDAGEAAWKGLTGEKKTSGGQLLRNAGIGDDSKGSAKLTDTSTWGVDDVLGLALDIFADPVDLALIPVTGGTSAIAKAGVKSADTATDTIKAIKQPLKLAKTAEEVSDIADAAKTINYVSKVGEVDDLARAVTGLTNIGLDNSYITRESLLNLLGRGVKQGTKATAKGADKAITWGLGKVDNAYLNSIVKQAAQQGIEITEDALKSADINSLVNSYQALKNSIGNVFNYKNALPGNLINEARKAQGGAEFASNRARVVLQDANQRLDDYVYNMLKSQGVDLSDLDNYFRNADNINIDDYLLNTRQADNFADVASNPNSLYNTIYNAKNQASLDVRDLIESGMDTRINGETVLRNLGKKGKDGLFRGTEDSVDQIARFLDSKGITYKTAVDPQGLGYTLSINRNAGNLKNFRELQKGQDTLNAFKNMDLNKSLGYTEDELKRIADLKANADLQTLANSVNEDYDTLAQIFADELGVDYSGITDRAGYVRRALAEGRSPFDTADNVVRTGKGNIGTQYFATREYTTPTIVTERLKSGDMSGVGEAVRAQGAVGRNVGLNEQQVAIRNVDTEIKRLNSQLSSSKKERLSEAIDTVKQKIETLSGPSKTELGIDESIAKVTAKEKKAQDAIDAAYNSITEEVVDKMNRVPTSSATKSFMKKSQAYGAANKAYNDYLNEFMKKFKKPGTYTEAEYTKALEKLDNLAQKRINAAYDIQIAASKVSGTIDDSTRSIIKTTDKAFSSTDSAYKALNDTAVRKEALSVKKELAKSARQEMHKSLTNKLSRLEDDFRNLVNTDEAVLKAQDTKILNQIETLQKTRDILVSKEGTKLFNDSYISGMDNFINYASKNAAGAKVYNEAIMNGTFYDDSLVLRSSDALSSDLIPKNMTKLSASQIGQMKAQLQTIRGILPDQTKAIDDLLDYIGTNNVYMDKNLVNLLKFGTQKEVTPILKLVNGFNNVFKRFKVFTPGFHLRNITGNATNLALSGIPVSQIPDLYTRAAKILDDDNIIDLMRKANLGTLTDAEQVQFDLLRQFVDNGFYRAGTGVQDLGEIVSKSYNVTEAPLTSFGQVAEAVGGTPLTKLKSKTLDKATDFSAMINDKLDSLNRMAALIYGNENPTYFRRLGFDNAADAVRYALFDPGNMSPTEINTIKKIIPFYTFTKQNLIYQVTNAAKNSSRYHQLIKAFDKAYDSMDEDSYRDYQKENFQLPLPFEDEDGNTIMLKMNLPVNDLTIFSSPQNTLQRIVSSTTPLIRAPFEQVTGVDTYTGQEIYRSGIEQLANYIGINSLTTDVWDKIEAIIAQHNGDMNSTEMWTEIFNSLAQYNNQEKIRNSNLYEEMERYSSLVSDLKKQGIEVPTIRDLTNTGTTRLTQLQRKRNKRNNSN